MRESDTMAASRVTGELKQACHRCTAPATRRATWAGGWLAITPPVPLVFCEVCFAEAVGGPGECGAARAGGTR